MCASIDNPGVKPSSTWYDAARASALHKYCSNTSAPLRQHTASEHSMAQYIIVDGAVENDFSHVASVSQWKRVSSAHKDAYRRRREAKLQSAIIIIDGRRPVHPKAASGQKFSCPATCCVQKFSSEPQFSAQAPVYY
eukprot:6193779-Pleurochrysis_carterae.AAC.1